MADYKFKRGDRVRVTGLSALTGSSSCKIGDTGTVKESSWNPWVLIDGRNFTEGSAEYPNCSAHLGENLELIEPQYKKLSPKVGDKFRVVKVAYNSDGVYFSTDAIGKVAEVEELAGDYVSFETKGCYIGHIANDCLTTEYLEPVEEKRHIEVPEGYFDNVNNIQLYANSMYETDFGHEEKPFFNIMENWIKPEIKHQTLKQKAMNIYRKARMSKEEKVLHKAGYMNDDGTPTSTGTDALMFHLWSENKKALVEMAQEAIDEQEK